MSQLQSFFSWLRTQSQRAWAWYRAQTRNMQIVVGISVFIVVLVLCRASAGAGNASTSGNTANHQATATHPAASHPTATPKPKATVKPLTSAPYVGGPFANFINKFGQPINSNDWFYTDSSQAILIGVKLSGNTVNDLTVLQVPDGWRATQLLDECKVFLPPGASQFNFVTTPSGSLTDYHSSVGEVIIRLDPATCDTYTA